VVGRLVIGEAFSNSLGNVRSCSDKLSRFDLHLVYQRFGLFGLYSLFFQGASIAESTFFGLQDMGNDYLPAKAETTILFTGSSFTPDPKATLMASVIHHRFTVEAYDQMIEAGIFSENDPVELINGEIVRKMPIGRLHGAMVNRLNQRLVTQFSGQAIVSVQNPIVADESEPEPDFAVLTYRNDFYSTSKPKAEDVRLLIEVADTSLEYDREIKLPLYARSDIHDFWIVNLIESKIEVYRDPKPDGNYGTRQDYTGGQTIGMLAFPNVKIDVDALFNRFD
jgi:Uma2 family endonuclease